MFFLFPYLFCGKADPLALVGQAMQLSFLSILESNVHIVTVTIAHGMLLEGCLIGFLLVREHNDDGSALLQGDQPVVLEMAAIEDGHPLGIPFPVEFHIMPTSFIDTLHIAGPACVEPHQLAIRLPFVLLLIELQIVVPHRAQQGDTVVLAPVTEDEIDILIHELKIQFVHKYSRPFDEIRVFANIIIPHIYINIKFSTSNHLL